MNKTILATAVASLMTHIPTSFAQEAADTTPKSQAQETMVVTANRFEQSAGKMTATLDYVTKDQLENLQIKSLSEALALLPGVQVAQNGGRGQSSSVYIRGSASNHVVVLYNGVRIGSATTGSANFTAIPLAGVERIELVKGARAAVYGADAIGGVINIITSSGASENTAIIKAGLGSDKYRQAGAGYSGKLGDKSWLNLSVNTEAAEGFDVGGTGPSQPDNDGYSRKDVNFEVGTLISDSWSANFMGFYHHSNSDYESYDGKAPDEQESELYNYAGSITYDIGRFSSVLSLSTNKDSSDNFGGTTNGSHLVTKRHAASIVNIYRINAQWVMNAGLDFTQDSVADSNIYSSGKYQKYGKTGRSNQAIFVSSLWDFDSTELEASIRQDGNSAYGQNTTWQLGAGYQLNQNVRFIASGGTAFQAPTYNNLYWPGYGNEDLQPEESLNFEAGAEVYTELADFRVVGYSNTITNLINYQSKGEELKNSDAHIKGIELSSTFDTGNLSHTVSMDFLDHNNKVNVAGWGKPEDIQTKKLNRRADFVAKWFVSYEYNDIRTDLSYQYQGKRFDDTKNTTELAPYSLVNWSLSYQVDPNWVVRAKVDNLFNEQYETAYKYNTQDRTYYLNTAYQF